MHVIAKCKMVFGYFHNCCQKWIISLQYYHKSPPPPSPLPHHPPAVYYSTYMPGGLICHSQHQNPTIRRWCPPEPLDTVSQTNSWKVM